MSYNEVACKVFVKRNYYVFQFWNTSKVEAMIKVTNVDYMKKVGKCNTKSVFLNFENE